MHPPAQFLRLDSPLQRGFHIASAAHQEFDLRSILHPHRKIEKNIGTFLFRKASKETDGERRLLLRTPIAKRLSYELGQVDSVGNDADAGEFASVLDQPIPH